MDKDKIEMKTTMESAAVAEYLTALAKGFKSGIITVEKGGESLTLMPVEIAEVEVEARVKKDKARFSLEVTWRMPQEQDEAGCLSISAEAPKAAAKVEKKDDNKACDKKDMKKAEAPAAPASAPKSSSSASITHATVAVVKPMATAAGDPKTAPKA